MAARKSIVAGLLVCVLGIGVAVFFWIQKARKPGVTINGYTWQVELATTRTQRYRGMSGRLDVGKNEGMLFIFPQPKVLEF